jgi:transcriptional regulator with XRE-family HTH domain
MATKKIIPEFLEIGQRLELIREAIGIEVQAEFAKLCGVQPNAYSQWAKGRARISLPFALQVVKATGATLDYIYLGKTDGLPMKFMRILQQGQQGGHTPDGSVIRKKAS